MYTRYFGLRENPFSIPPDPNYLYLGRSHQEALAHLQFGIVVSGGFGQLTGEVGTGKTLLIRALVEELPDDVEVALILYPVLTVLEFIAAICDELRVTYPSGNKSIKILVDALNQHLLENHAKGRRTVLIIDEAQSLNREVLEQIRLLTNLETTKQKLLHIILIGQPELRSLLGQRDLRQLDQRITTRYRLNALPSQETCDYIVHRCQVAGAKTQLFTNSAMRQIHKLSGGIPRLINIICDRALMGAYALEKPVVDAGLARTAAAEVGVKHPRRYRPRARYLVPMALASMLVALAGWQLPVLLKSITPDEMKAEITKQAEPFSEEQGSPQTSVQVAVQTAELHPQSLPPTVSDVEQAGMVVTIEEATGANQRLVNLLKDPTIVTDSNTAMEGLFLRWGLGYSAQSGGTACKRARNAGLQCIYETGTWNNLRNYNRPAVIELMDTENRRHHMLVSALKTDSVALVLGGKVREFPLSEVDQQWFGKYLLLWNPQRLTRGNLQIGMRGEVVLWLREVLARYKGVSPPVPQSDLFDEELLTQIIEFQKDHHLEADGIVGELTMLQLNSYSPNGRPPLLVDASVFGAE